LIEKEKAPPFGFYDYDTNKLYANMKNEHFYLDKIPGRQPRKDKD